MKGIWSVMIPSRPSRAVPGSRSGGRRSTRTRARWMLGSAALVVALTPEIALLAQAPLFKVVANASNPATSLPAAEVSKLFLKKVDRWEGGFRVSPVDQQPDSRARVDFSRAIHRKDVDAIRKYWRKMAFSGMGTPPPELESDAAVLDFVAHNVGGVGYVAASTALVDRVKVLKITGLEKK